MTQVIAWAAVLGWLTVGYLSARPAVAAAYRAAEDTPAWDFPSLLTARLVLVLCTALGPVTWIGSQLAGDRSLRRMVPEYDRARTLQEDRERAAQARDLELSLQRLGREINTAHAVMGIRPLSARDMAPGGVVR